MADLIGRTILHYKITEQVGQGGMGVVYKAEDTKLKREVAIKFLPRQIASNSEERARFKIEAQAAATLNHPNIATIHAIEEVDDEMFIVMEFIEGQELKDIVGATGPVAPTDAINYATQIASGLQAAHEKDVTHRDIKSANIMVTDKGQVKIMDFGLAKVRGGAQVTKMGTTLGTAAYMSPEQAQGLKTDHRTDIWAFGVVLYEMLTGRMPFPGDYEQAVIYSILNEEPEFPEEISANLQQILQKALSKDLNDRYQNIGEVLANLESSDAGKTSGVAKSLGANRHSPLQNKRIFLYGGIILLILLAGLIFFQNRSQPIDSLAVLPLDNLSGDPAQEYFSDGMTEALITYLSKISALKVISRTSVMQFKDSKKTLPEIARELGVKAVIEGSVMRDGDRVRITAQLIEAESDRHLWADSYERNLTDIFALQRDIAQAIAAQVKVTLTPGEQQQLQDAQPIDPRAYEAYLKGIHHVIRYNTSDLLKSLGYFSQAVEIEPDFALGYVGIVRACMGLMDQGGPPFSELYPKAKSALEKALQLDNSLGETHSVQGKFRQIAEWDFTGAERAFRKSLELNPNLGTTYQDYAIFLVTMERREEALTMITKARSLDPLSPFINNDVAWVHYYARRYDEAIREYQNNLETHPDFIMSHRELSWVYAQKSMFGEAIQSIQRAIALERSSLDLSYLAQIYAMAGKKEEAHEILNKLLSTRTEYLPAFEIAGIYIALGDFDEAFRWLEISYQEHSGDLIYIKATPDFEPLRSDPRYAPFLRKMGLEP